MIDAAHDEWLTDGVMGRRVAAFLIDGVLAGILVALAHVALFTFGLLTLGLGLPLLGLLPLVPVAYLALSVASERSATPGQLALGLVVRANHTLDRPSLLQAVVWAVGLTVTVALGAIWVLVALVTVRHRTLHDLAAGVVVTRTRALTPRTGIWTLDTRPGRPFA